jgi:cysteine-rich secretory family protein
MHNRERAAVGVPPLVWSATLAAGAKTWAEQEATLNRSEHSPGADRIGLGENIAEWGHYPGALTDMVQFWINEKKDYHGGVLDQSNLYQVGHYTQVVWRNTTEIGCGMATGSNGNDFLVCRYSPSGNQFGQLPY